MISPNLKLSPMGKSVLAAMRPKMALMIYKDRIHDYLHYGTPWDHVVQASEAYEREKREYGRFLKATR